MRCWACSKPIMLADLVAELPIVGAIVHVLCYHRETGQRPRRSMTARDALRQILGGKRRRSPQTGFIRTRAS